MTLQVHAVEDSFESIGRHLGDLMDEMTRRSYYHFSRSVAWQPAVNVYHDPKNFYLCVELAGLRKEEIHVDINGSKITVKGNRSAAVPPEGEEPTTLLRMEISSGAFERCIELPERADMETVSAHLVDGYLWITVRKRGAQ